MTQVGDEIPAGKGIEDKDVENESISINDQVNNDTSPTAPFSQINNPTGKGVRNDPAGAGHFGASRGRRSHLGLDLLAKPGQEIKAPVSGRFIVTSIKTATIEVGEGWYFQLIYVTPDKSLHGKNVEKGEVIGIAEDMANIRYPNASGMKNHVHLQLVVPKEVPDSIQSGISGRYFLDPTPFLDLPDDEG